MEKEKKIALGDVWLKYDETSSHSYAYKYPRWCVTADTVVFRRTEDKLMVLLIKRGNEPYKGMWALPGGFVDVDEDVTTGALRELKEEAGIEVAEIHQLACYSKPRRDPRAPVLTIAHYAFTDSAEVNAGDDAAEARWFDTAALPDLAFDHKEIITDGVERVR